MPTAPQTIDPPFWRFSLDLYGRDGVASACLDLQDRAGLDVNLLLFAVWLGEEGRPAREPSAWRAWQAAIAPWLKAGIQPLRTLRRSLKEPVAGVTDEHREHVRRLVSASELAAERVAQSILSDLAPPPNGDLAEAGADAAIANLSAYLIAVGRRLDAADRQALNTLLQAAFGPDCEVGRLPDQV